VARKPDDKDDDTPQVLLPDERIERVLINGSIHRGPDPTVLTTQALNEAKANTKDALDEAKRNIRDAAQEAREVALHGDQTVRTEMLTRINGYEKELDLRFEGLVQKIEARLDGMDKATTLQLAEALRYPNAIERAVHGLRELHDKDIDKIVTLLSERDKRFKQAEEAALRTTELALAAPADAAARVEKNTSAQQEFNVSQFQQIVARLDRIEGVTQGAELQAQRGRNNSTMLISVLGVLLVATSVIIAFLEATHG